MSGRQRDERRATERVRRERTRTEAASTPSLSRRAAARSCGWCGHDIQVRPVGRIPTWCSARCRQRAWEQKRAAESGLAAVRVVERVIANTDTIPRRRNWLVTLAELTDQLDQGRIYRRDLPDLATALDNVLNAFAEPPIDHAGTPTTHQSTRLALMSASFRRDDEFAPSAAS